MKTYNYLTNKGEIAQMNGSGPQKKSLVIYGTVALVMILVVAIIFFIKRKQRKEQKQ
jgi:uncharacterized membrane protein YvbJ